MRKLSWLAILALGGCVGETYRNPEPNPFRNVKRIAVAPFLDKTGAKDFDGSKAGDAFASELLLHPGFDVVRPSQVLEAASAKGLRLETADDYIAVAKALDADAIVAAEITEVRSYFPPRTTVALQLLLTQRVKASASDLERHVVSARPLAISPETSLHLDQHFELVADDGDDNTRAELRSYASARVDEDSPWRDGEGIARSREPWWRFVCALCVERIVDSELDRGRAERGPHRWHDQEDK
ncbi:MAG: hypothetical protein K8T20_01285 [Planctomycetes bacterium]|nr:hypothetical protein [Planctomycetota bacterium]